MSIKQSVKALLLTVLATTAMNVNAADINADHARLVANNYLKQHVTSSAGMLKAPAHADLRLAHVEKASTLTDQYDYYAFNIAIHRSILKE